jgi:hypothetical protein
MLLKTSNYFSNFKIWQQKPPSKSGSKKTKKKSPVAQNSPIKKRGADNTKYTISLLLSVFFYSINFVIQLQW